MSIGGRGIRSLAYLTDLIFPRFDGEVVDRERYVVVRTPSNPTFHWGNYLLYREPPRPGDLERWRADFVREIPNVRHLAFGWDLTAEGEALSAPEEFARAGFVAEDSVVLGATHVRAPRYLNNEIEIRELVTAGEWDAAAEIQVACRDTGYEENSYREFSRRRMECYRRMVEAGRGAWFGAFSRERAARAGETEGQVANLGIFITDVADSDARNGLARFQNVATHPDFRRRGICGTLVSRASEIAARAFGARSFVMVADESGDARRIYESVGFSPCELQRGVSWWERG